MHEIHVVRQILRYELVPLLQLSLQAVDGDLLMVQLFLELVVVDFGADLLHVDVRHLPLVELLVANFGWDVLEQVRSWS